MPALAPLLWSLISWLFRSVIIQFVVMSVVLVVVSQLMPLVMGYVAGFFNASGFNGLFAAITPGTWYFLDMFALDIGLPVIISAYVSRFLIRRIPFLG
jgi:hypothetical protein